QSLLALLTELQDFFNIYTRRVYFKASEFEQLCDAFLFLLNKTISGLSYAKSEDAKIKRAVSTIKRNNKVGRNDLDERGYVYVLP
ncbi:hypothetical protein MJM95_29515, partial [Salmonella enterica subsp. enterica serovar Anatum]|nr:hypothetical protein [Salmonella enterica subsp. enterica serovar Anatum]